MAWNYFSISGTGRYAYHLNDKYRVKWQNCCVYVVFVALLFSWPAPVLFGSSAVQTVNSHMNGTRCYTEDKKNFAKYQAYFNSLLILVILVCFIVLTVLYTLIWRTIAKHNGQKHHVVTDKSKDSSSNTRTTDTVEMTSQSNDSTENKTQVRNEKEIGQTKKVNCVESDSEILGGEHDEKKR